MTANAENRRRVSYEWVVEETDDQGDIVECCYFDDRAQAEWAFLRVEGSADFGLCRHVWSEADGEISRGYCYFEGGVLGDRFDDGTSVPARFR